MTDFILSTLMTLAGAFLMAAMIYRVGWTRGYAAMAAQSMRESRAPVYDFQTRKRIR